jgi:type III secretory pathway component EscS
MLWLAFWLLLPFVVVIGASTLLTSIIQLVTGLQDATFATVPRLFAAFVTLLLWLKWASPRLTAYTASILQHLTQNASH